MRFRVLSVVEARSGNEQIDIGYAKHRLVLAILLTAQGQLVSTDQMIDHIWDDEPPRTARDLIHGYISDLRARLDRGGHLLPQHNGGYRIQVGRDQVDLHRFHDLVATSQSLLHHDDHQAVRLLREALDQWDGSPTVEPLAGLAGRWAANYRRTLREEHHSALVNRIEAELRLGLCSRLIPELSDLANANPLDEKVAELLMRAFYQAGRRADASNTYLSTRKRLQDELGSDPSEHLDHLYQRILNQDPALAAPMPMESAIQPERLFVSLQIHDIAPKPREESLALHKALNEAMAAAGFGDAECQVLEQPDGVLIIMPEPGSAVRVLGSGMDKFYHAIRERNGDPKWLRVRIGVHTGHPAASADMARGLGDSDAARRMVAAAHKASVVVVVDDQTYQSAVLPHDNNRYIDPNSYNCLPVRFRDTDVAAWVYVPGYSTPPALPSETRQRPDTSESDQKSPRIGTVHGPVTMIEKPVVKRDLVIGTVQHFGGDDR
jgi:DNA-binding SARP family transcriptional activator